MSIATRKQNLSQAVAQIREAIADALAAADIAVRKALRVGQLIAEAKPLVGHGNFKTWIEKEFPDISYETANRWVQVSERVIAAVKLEPDKLAFPISHILSAKPDDLAEPERQAQQLMLDFTNNKTIKECLQSIVIDGDEAHRLTRAHNGRTKGGFKGENRKDFPAFIAYHLSDVSSHLRNYRSYTGPQLEATETAFKVAVAKWPTPLLETLRRQITDELKKR